MIWWMIPIAFVVSTMAIGSGIESPALFNPVLRLVGPAFHVPPMSVSTAIFSGLAIQVVGFFSGSVGHFRHGNIDTALLRRWILPTLTSVAVGAVVSLLVSGVFLDVAAATTVSLATARVAGLRLGQHWRPSVQVVLGAFMMGLVGVGLGPTLAPLFLEQEIAPRRAVGTVVPLILLGVVVAGLVRVVGMGSGVHPRWSFVIPSWFAVIVGGQLAAPLLARISPRQTRTAMIIIFALAALAMFFDGFRQIYRV